MSIDYTFVPLNPLQRDGTNRNQRLLSALDPDSPDFVKIDERSRKDLVKFANEFAKQIIYYNADNLPDGYWDSFFNLDLNDLLCIIKNSTLEPHLALYLAFLELLRYAQKDINTITQRHLDFYYKQFLQFPERAPVPDKVHLIFTVARNVDTFLLTAGNLLSAGKDIMGKELLYGTDADIVLNKASVESLKTVFVDIANGFKLYAADVANSADGFGKKLQGTNATWNTFGESQKDKAPRMRTMRDADIGIALASDLFLLSEGTRIISLTFHLRKFKSGDRVINFALNNSFLAYLSGEKGWVGSFMPFVLISPDTDVSIPDNENYYYYKLEMTLTIPSETPPITNYNDAIIKEGYNTQLPLLKLMLNNNDTDFIYLTLNSLELLSIDITVSVNGLTDLIIETDQGTVNSKKPFQPFGAIPIIGSSFYVGASELMQKDINVLTIHIIWLDMPKDIESYYARYQISSSSQRATIASFIAKLNYKKDDEWNERRVYLFDAAELDTKNIYINSTDLDSKSNAPINENFVFSFELTDPTNPPYQIQAFGHKEYPPIYTAAAIAQSKLTTPDPSAFPYPPYTPVIKQLTIDYTSSKTYSGFETSSEDEIYGAQYFYIEPFGQRQVISAEESGIIYFLPQYLEEGNLYFGMKDLTPPQILSVYFQLAEGTGSKAIEGLEINWSYLSNNHWILLSDLNILSDTTNQFQVPGIINIEIPEDATSNNTILPFGLYWIKAATENSGAASKLINVKAQAVTATFIDNNNDPGHLLQPLPANTITKFVTRHAEITGVSQPSVSFGGKPTELTDDYYKRISERLRHKKRAIQIWDYERMALEHFPSLYKVKCLNHTSVDTPTIPRSEIAPGYVTLVVIPDLKNKNAANPLQPRTPENTLEEIGNFIAGHASPFVQVNVENPLYELILVDCKVGFYAGFDPGYYGNQLNEEIKKFLSPWAYEEGEDIIFENTIYKSKILAFIENRPYVDFVTDFYMYHIFDGFVNNGIGEMVINMDFIVADPPGTDPYHPTINQMAIDIDFVIGYDVESAVAKTSKSILVSASEHRISVLPVGEYNCEGQQDFGIGMMAVEVDFIVEKPQSKN
jgi:hypothetical protein